MALACTVCGSSATQQEAKNQSPFTGEWYTRWRCHDCQSRFFDLNEHPVNLAGLYDRIVGNGCPVEPTFQRSACWTQEVKQISCLFGGTPQSVLDLGCGTGNFLLHWPADTERYGVDVAESTCRIARSRGLEVTHGYLEESHFARPFDVVTCYAVIEHLASPTFLLKQIGSYVRENGILVVMIPCRESLKARVLELAGVPWHMYSPPAHLNFLSREFLDGFLRGEEFELVRRRYTSGGMLNPFRRVPLMGSVWSRLMWMFDAHSYGNRLPIFDHMYSYYRRRAGESERIRPPRAV